MSSDTRKVLREYITSIKPLLSQEKQEALKALKQKTDNHDFLNSLLDVVLPFVFPPMIPQEYYKQQSIHIVPFCLEGKDKEAFMSFSPPPLPTENLY
jgi:hypothetical protein